MNEKTYELIVVCGNCGKTQIIEVPFCCKWQDSYMLPLVPRVLAGKVDEGEEWKGEGIKEEADKNSGYIKNDMFVMQNCKRCGLPMLRKIIIYGGGSTG